MSRVRRVRIEVDIENDDGSTTSYDTEGTPSVSGANVQLEPHFDSGLGLVSRVTVSVQANLLPVEAANLYRVRESAPEQLVLTESPSSRAE